MKKNKILIIGMGPVGLATAIGFAHCGLDVVGYDIDKSRIASLKLGKCPFYEEGLQAYLDKYSKHLTFTDSVKEAFSATKYYFIAVGTPLGRNNEADMTAFWSAIGQITDNFTQDGLIVIKSTVPVGTNGKVKTYLAEKGLETRLDVVSNPEFLAQGTSVVDTIQASRIVIGTNCQTSLDEMLKLYDKFPCEKILTTPVSAELIKYESNCYLAMRVSFVNDLAVACELVGADVQAVLRGVSQDPRIGDRYFYAGIGYGGSCFPKDTVAFHNQLQTEYGYELELVEATMDINKRQCLYLCRKMAQDLGTLSDKHVAILGVAFKKDTDEVRNSLAIENIQFLKANGAHVTVWDPKATPNCKAIFGDSIYYESSLERAVRDNDVILILTDWDEVVNLDLRLLGGKNVYDGKNLFLNGATSAFKYTYIGGSRKEVRK